MTAVVYFLILSFSFLRCVGPGVFCSSGIFVGNGIPAFSSMTLVGLCIPLLLGETSVLGFGIPPLLGEAPGSFIFLRLPKLTLSESISYLDSSLVPDYCLVADPILFILSFLLGVAMTFSACSLSAYSYSSFC